LARRVVVMHREIVPFAAEILRRLASLGSGHESGAGNRRSGFALTIEGAPPLFARRLRRGGLMRFLVSETFFGFSPRPLRELEVTVESHRRGIAVAPAMGAIVERIAPAAYRGYFLTREIGGMTLWEFLRTDDDPAVSGHVLAQARSAIDAMHARGLLHADLNLHNLMVVRSGESFAVTIIDLDKARLYPEQVPSAMRRSNFARLSRSARKLDPKGKFIDEAALKMLAAG
ncbi:MAG TPA: lipopolysaccharide kinase InaA family protein, partial [Candidatus Binataceae bacterium]